VSAERRSFAFNSVYATVSAGSAGLLLLLLMLAGRLLSAADYGRFSYALALATILETVMDVGLGHVTVRAVAREREQAGRIFQDVLGLKLVWVALGLGLLFVVAPALRRDPALVRTCYLLGCSSAVRSYLLTARGLLQGVDRFDVEAGAVVLDRLLLLGLGAAALVSGYGLNGLTLAFVLARAIMFVVVTLIVRRIAGSARPTFDRRIWRDLQVAALPLGFFMIALNLYTYVDTVILGVMRTDAETGWYAAAYRVYEGLTYAPSVLAAVLTPRLSYLFVNDRPAMRALLRRILWLSAGLGLLLGGIAVWLAGPVVTLLFGRAYGPSAAPLQILAGGAVFVFCTWILHAAAIGTNLDRRLVGTTLVGLGSNVILNVIFIPRWGISGAAAATVIAEAATAGLLYLQVRQRLRIAAAPNVT
jgi:O-antigen/teichoic acid export membrane protein